MKVFMTGGTGQGLSAPIWRSACSGKGDRFPFLRLIRMVRRQGCRKFRISRAIRPLKAVGRKL